VIFSNFIIIVTFLAVFIAEASCEWTFFSTRLTHFFFLLEGGILTGAADYPLFSGENTEAAVAP
jgi:hypothetical protein